MGKNGSFVKRCTDIVISILILLLSIPMFIIIAFLIKLDSKGNVFFIQERTGLGGKPFKMIKFRGMVNNALEIGPQLTQKNDPRITRVGKVLRRTSLDELPQLINVFRGEMSLVGPRPEIPSITSGYSNEQKEVFKFKPGITGYSQINGRQLLSPQERVKMEIDYYTRSDFWSDILIATLTLKVVINNSGNI